MALGYIVTFTNRVLGTNWKLDSSKMREFLQNCWIADSTKARQLLGYQPRHSLDAGLKKTIRWYQEHGWL